MNKKQFYLSVIILILVSVSIQKAAAQGAKTPFVSYEAEDGNLAGGATILSMISLPSAPTVQLESSGRKCVELNATGESVSWITTDITNTIVVRLSMPDAPTGGGITDSLNLYVDGVFRQSIVCSSKYTWVYGVNAMIDNNPATGTPKRFFDMHRAFIKGEPVAAGSTITLTKDVLNTASYYRIDFVLLENVGPALTQPANTLSVISYGATPNDNTDDTQAFKNCISACQSQKKGMWIPAGNFYTGGSVINATGINIYGAGMWYTTNTRIIGGRHKWNLTNCSIQDLYIFNPEVGRELAQGHDYGMTIQGASGWTVQRVWLHRGGACFWCSGTGGTIRDCRATESWADGINLNNSGSVNADYAGLRLTAQNNYIVGSGDDGIAINAQNGGGAPANMDYTQILNNTSIGCMWGNGMRVAGGRNSLLQNNLITDPTDCNGIRVGEFGVTGNPCESVLIKDNLILRGCGIRTNYGHGGIAVCDDAVATINSNTIWDSPGIGIDVQSGSASYTSNIIINSALQGILIKSNSVGNAVFTTNTVANLKSGQIAFRNDAASPSFTSTLDGNSWQVAGVVFYGENNYTGSASQTLSIGSYTMAQLAAIGCPNDWASSVKVPVGLELVLYSEDNFTGKSQTLTENTSSFTAYNFDKLVSSIKINKLTTSVVTTQNNQNDKFTIYPNPVENSLHINGIEKPVFATIRNLTGSVVRRTETSGVIDVTNLSSGIYLIDFGGNISVRFIKK